MTVPRVVEHTGLGGLSSALPALDELFAQADCPVTTRGRWLAAWARTHPSWEPWVITVVDPDGSILGAAALARARRGPLVRVVGLGHGTADEARLPIRATGAAPALAVAVAHALDALRRPWALLVEQLPVDCPVAAELTARLSRVRVIPGQGLPMMEVGSDRDPNRYLSRNARNAENKASNRLRTAGHHVSERWLTDPADVAAAVPRMSAVHRERDRQLGRVSDHDDPYRAAFYRQVLVDHAEARELDLLLVEIDGDLAAYVAGFRDGSALRVWDNRLSPRWAPFSAGRLANHAAIRHVLADPGLDVLDWMRGEEPYKLSSATRVVPTQTLEAWSSTAARLPYAGKDKLRRARDRSPQLDRSVRWLRLRSRRVVQRVSHGPGRPAGP